MCFPLSQEAGEEAVTTINQDEPILRRLEDFLHPIVFLLNCSRLDTQSKEDQFYAGLPYICS